MIEDGAGYRPIDYVDPNSAIADLCKSWMARADPPSLYAFGEVDAANKSATMLKLQTM